MEEITAPVILTRQRIALCHRVQVSNLDVTKCLRIVNIFIKFSIPLCVNCLVYKRNFFTTTIIRVLAVE